MTGCCGEWNCARKIPITLYLGPFTGQVFAATSSRLVKDHGDGTATFSATARHDVTASMRQFIRCNPDWVRAVLNEAEYGVVSDPPLEGLLNPRNRGYPGHADGRGP